MAAESKKLFALESPVEHRHIDAMRRKPGGAAAQLGQLRGCLGDSSCLTPASLVWRFSRL